MASWKVCPRCGAITPPGPSEVHYPDCEFVTQAMDALAKLAEFFDRKKAEARALDESMRDEERLRRELELWKRLDGRTR